MYRFQKPMQKCLKSTVTWWTSFRIYLIGVWFPSTCGSLWTALLQILEGNVTC